MVVDSAEIIMWLMWQYGQVTCDNMFAYLHIQNDGQ